MASSELAAQERVIVVDAGTRWTRAGFAASEAPLCVRTMVDVPRRPAPPPAEVLARYNQEEAISRRGAVRLLSPLAGGAVADWRDLEAFLHSMFSTALRVAPEEASGLLWAESVRTSAAERERLAQLLLEEFSVRALRLCPSAALVARAAGVADGLVVQVGDGLASASPVCAGRVVESAQLHVTRGGGAVTDELIGRLAERGFLVSTQAEREIVYQLKEATALVRSPTVPPASASCYELPDGQLIELDGAERELMMETLFQGGSSLPQLCAASMHALAAADESAVVQRLVLAGGCSSCAGLGARLVSELAGLCQAPVGLLCTPPPVDPRLAVWHGGALVARASDWRAQAISWECWGEEGARALERFRYS